MDDAVTYHDPVKRLLDLARDTFGTTMRAYYEGDPIVIPKANMPCIIAEKIETLVTTVGAPTGHDMLSERVALRLVLNKMDDSNLTDEYDLTERKLRNFVEARDLTTGQFLQNSLMYAFRTNISLANSIRNQEITITYGLQPRPEGQFTSEATLEVIIDELVPVTNRV